MKRIPCPPLALLLALVAAALAAPVPAAAQCHVESSIQAEDLVTVYAKSHSDDTVTLWFVHPFPHKVLCSSAPSGCDSEDGFVWRQGSSGNVNVWTAYPDDGGCGERFVAVATNPSQSTTVRMRMKFSENYYSSSPPVRYPRFRNFDVVFTTDSMTPETLYPLTCSGDVCSL